MAYLQTNSNHCAFSKLNEQKQKKNPEYIPDVHTCPAIFRFLFSNLHFLQNKNNLFNLANDDRIK